MFSKIVVVTAGLVLGAAAPALAADHEDQEGGFRELGTGATITEGVNPADHRSLRDAESAEDRAVEEKGTREREGNERERGVNERERHEPER